MVIARAKSKDFDRIELSRSNLKGEKWTTIHVDRSDDSSNVFLRFTDNNVERGGQYIYRVQTIDQSGLKSAFAFSGTVQSIKISRVEKVNSVVAQQMNNEVLVSWEGSPSEEIYYDVYRSINNGSMKQIGRSSNNQFRDQRPVKGNVSYAVKRMHSDGSKSTISTQKSIVVK